MQLIVVSNWQSQIGQVLPPLIFVKNAPRLEHHKHCQVYSTEQVVVAGYSTEQVVVAGAAVSVREGERKGTGCLSLVCSLWERGTLY